MKTQKVIFFLFSLLVAIQQTSGSDGSGNQELKKPNILFVIVDDLRPELGCYGNEIVESPSIDKLAAEGVVFNRAYCQFPVCGPSRCSLLTGLRPNRTRFTSNRSMVDKEVPEYPTLPEYLKRNGYHTISNGKVFHDHGNVIDGLDGWSEIPWEPHPGFWVWRKEKNKKYSYKGYQYRDEYRQNPGPSYESVDGPDDIYPTGEVTDKTIYDLRRLKKMDKPFFLAVGYRKPHLPHNSPKKYWDFYDPEIFSLASNFRSNQNIPAKAFHNSSELRVYRDIPNKGEIKESTWLKLIHAYYANVSYTDAQIGRLVDELEALNLKDETIIIVLGDHGYQLTNHGMWSKRTNFHDAMHAPLIISAHKKSIKTNSIVEFIDLFPTIADLCGLDIPEHLDGNSLKNLVENGSEDEKQLSEYAFSRVGDGETIISSKYIYTEWINDQGKVYERMLFDLINDPLETKNLAESSDHNSVVEKLSIELHDKIEKEVTDKEF